MPTTPAHYAAVARQLKCEFNGHAFRTIDRIHIKNLLSAASGENIARLTRFRGECITAALNNHAVQTFPELADTTTGDSVRIYHSGVANQLGLIGVS